MVAKTFGAALHGVDAHAITIEVSVGQGINTFLVGLPDSAVKESLMRVEIAIKSAGLQMPRQRVVINLAPADIPKTGTGFDLPIALAILAASGQLKHPDILREFIVMGELGLDGSILPVRGILPIALLAQHQNFKGMIVPKANQPEASLVSRELALGMNDLKGTVDFLNNADRLLNGSSQPKQFLSDSLHQVDFIEDFADVKGQDSMKRVLEIAAAGGHNVLFTGPPGSGKTMLSRRLPSILPPMSINECLETSRVHSVAGHLSKGLVTTRPFRSPHHTTSDVALAGGGTMPQPGEISLAHNGILFLDELPEFKRQALEVLRQPLEEHSVQVSRAKMTLRFPADFMLVASMNPCPCGYHNHPDRQCTCSTQMIRKYVSRISGPLLDRIDLQLKVLPVPFYELERAPRGENSSTIRARVTKVRSIQSLRGSISARLSSREIQTHCVLDEGSKRLLYKTMSFSQLSARAYERILKVSRTIADLAGSESIKIERVAEAVHYRGLDVHMASLPMAKSKGQVFSLTGCEDDPVMLRSMM